MSEKKIFAISDVHGCADELRLLIRSLPLEDDCTIVFLGDYVDRGGQSKEVIDTILKLKQRYDVITLMGNHEHMFIEFLKDPSSADAGMFIFNGGSATLASYSDDLGQYEIPEEHAKFLTDLALYYETDDYVFVHAGLPDIELSKLKDKDYSEEMLWIREAFFESRFDWGKIVIHGHTPDRFVQFTPKRICIDTGCVFNGKLSAIELPSKKVHQVAKQSEWKHYFLKDKSSQRRAVRFDGSIPVVITCDQGQILFETRNYTEFGMLIKDVVRTDEFILKAKDMILGEIGDNRTETAIRFKGEVIRGIKEDDGIYYAINFLTPPHDFQDM